MTLMFISFVGGVALFLLGMKLLTDGLKLAAGDALRNLLARYTSTPGKGVLSGGFITAMVQSSSAVIFATIGFVNAGLMTLLQATYVIFGSNVGTTFTGWIIAVIGFRVDLQLLAMPLLALGMALWLIKGSSKTGAAGQALTGFSIFFLGIDILKNTFGVLGDQVGFEELGTGIQALMLMFFLGIILTTVMQSSSATIALVITAVATGVIPLEYAAILVIGADLGTTSTALFAVIGSTANAKRAALVHVLFNAVKAPVAILLMSFYLKMILWAGGPGMSPEIVIAIFHTAIKLTGLAIMLPLAGKITTFLNKRFTERDINPATTRYLDEHTLDTPAFAIPAVVLELKRLARKSTRFTSEVIRQKRPRAELLKMQKESDALNGYILDFLLQMQRKDYPEDLEFAMPNAIRITQYLQEARTQSGLLLGDDRQMKDIPPHISASLDTIRSLTRSFLKQADSERKHFSKEELSKLSHQLESQYELTKSLIMKSCGKGEIKIEQMVSLHDTIRNYRRIWDQYFKASVYLGEFDIQLDRNPATSPKLLEAEHSDK
ncbi:MAG: Na/Pi symporter [Balneolales bacterium]|nr:Na/Pi symporter [Balneolales bacterium]